MDLSKATTDELVREIKRRNAQTYLEGIDFTPSRGRTRISKSHSLLLSMKVGEVKRLYHEDIYCHYAKHKYNCGLAHARETLKKKSIQFSVIHEKEHVHCRQK
jgi:hypothetical protein